MRTFLPKRDDERESVISKQLRTDRPFLPYARRSDPTAKDAKKDKTQSREMQTEDMIKWGKEKGWPESLIYPYFADLGLSGTLAPDQRPDILRLFEDLDSGKFDHSTIGCWQENRLFRDEIHIYYNQLIEKMLQHDVVLVVISPRLYIYDMRDSYDRETLEIERKRLIEAKEQLTEEANNDIGALEEELIKLKAGWQSHSFKKRRSLLNFAVREVIIDVMSTHWVRREVLWLYEEWGREEMYYRRKKGKTKGWSDEETTILLENYATMPKVQLMALLPDRGWEAITRYANYHELSRPMGRPKGVIVGGNNCDSYSDLQFLRRENIPDCTTRTNWNASCSPRR